MTNSLTVFLRNGSSVTKTTPKPAAVIKMTTKFHPIAGTLSRVSTFPLGPGTSSHFSLKGIQGMKQDKARISPPIMAKGATKPPTSYRTLPRSGPTRNAMGMQRSIIPWKWVNF